MTLSRRPFVALCLLGLSACTSQPAPGRQSLAGKRLTLENTVKREVRVSFGGTLDRWSWAPDGKILVRKRGKQTTWFSADGTHTIEPPALDSSTDKESEYPLLKIERLAERGHKEIFLIRSKEERTQLTFDSESDNELAELSPDGTHVAFVRANNLMLVNCQTSKLELLSQDGSSDTFNGKLDWVYQEEIYGRGNFKAFWWSPDSKHVAFLRLDESDVHPFTVVDHIDLDTQAASAKARLRNNFRVQAELTKYPKAGDPNPTVKLGIIATQQPATVCWIDLSRYSDSEPLVVRVLWNAAGNRLLYMIQDRVQSWLALNAVNPDDGSQKALIHEVSENWTNRSSAPKWLADGSFLWLSERTGFRHIYHYGADGIPIQQVTDGPWSVGAISHVDASGNVLFSSTEDGAIQRNTYRVSLDGSHLMRLTRGDGSHRLSFNADHSAYLDQFSSLGSPPRVSMHTQDGVLIRHLASSNMEIMDSYATSEWELHEIPARDGVMLDVALLKPVDFDASREYPVWLPTYSGPNAPSVRDRWSTSSWFQYLAQNGVLVLQVNVRSASGKGQGSTATCHKQLGIQELKDLQDAVAWLTEKPYADAERVGITGHSYGGFMSAFALTHSDTFALGIASSGVYDWRMYDSIYTERYMQTPDLNPEGYEATSVIAAAKNLQGHLILTHGVMDDNVHFQNTVQLVYELQQAGKPFELMIYPQSRHGIRDPAQRWLARKIEWSAIEKHLLLR